MSTECKAGNCQFPVSAKGTRNPRRPSAVESEARWPSRSFIRHKGVRHPGLHEPIVDRELWEKTQLLLRSQAVRGASRATKSAASPLMGRLFDERGVGLTPSHAVKGKRRYRYYVSRTLIKGTSDPERSGWRLPAPEIERTVASAAYTILSDQAAIADAAHTIRAAENRLPSIFSVAAVWMKRLQSDVEVGAALNALVDRVDLTDKGIRVSIKLPICSTGEQHGANATELTITRVFPMQIRRRGFEMRLVIQGGSHAPAPMVNLALMKAIARGRRWSDDLLAGRVESVAVIAKREGVFPNYVRRLIRLAFLAPRIVEAIATGHQPAELTAKALTERIELPLLWSEQERSACGGKGDLEGRTARRRAVQELGRTAVRIRTLKRRRLNRPIANGLTYRIRLIAQAGIGAVLIALTAGGALAPTTHSRGLAIFLT